MKKSTLIKKVPDHPLDAYKQEKGTAHVSGRDWLCTSQYTEAVLVPLSTTTQCAMSPYPCIPIFVWGSLADGRGVIYTGDALFKYGVHEYFPAKASCGLSGG